MRIQHQASASLIFVVALAAAGLVARAEDNQLDWLEPDLLEMPIVDAPAEGAEKECPTLEELGHQARLVEINLNICIADGICKPKDCSCDLFSKPEDGCSTRRYDWAETEFNWAASELYHQPLYWEDALLERYGQTHHPLVQPWLSGAHFFATFPIIPYKIGLDRTHDRIYTLGYYRPGSPTPCLSRRLRVEADAATLEAASWAAVILLLP